jgi:DNA-binding MarR family transcriptional regulator/GNAT superfamily N-acetyltransferase
MTSVPHLMETLGPLAFASRLRRISEHLGQDVARLYREQNATLEPRGFLLFYQLGSTGPQPIMELAVQVGLTHPAVIQIAADLEKSGLLKAAPKGRDRRQRILMLTEEGHALFARLGPLWQDIRSATEEVLLESGGDLLGLLAEMERALERKGIRERVRKRQTARLQQQLEILPYKPAWKRHFEALNRAWIEHHFQLEPKDAALLADPRKHVFQKGGAIFFARVEGRIVGTCALLPVDQNAWEMIKLAVTPEYQGQQVGRRLVERCIAEVRARNGLALLARTSPLLQAANALYRRLGFDYLGKDPSADYARETIVFRLSITP